MSEAREELLARQKACAAVLKDVQETLKEEGLESSEESVSVTGIALQLYLAAYSMKLGYWTAAFYMADRYCDFAGIDSREMHSMAISLIELERGEN
jgi:hypothetical protein